MATYNGNDVFLTINGKNVGTLWRGFEMSLAIGDENVSAGSGVDWEAHASKLKVITATARFVYDTSSAAADIAAVMDWATDDVVAVVYGPEGNTTGKPKHDQSFLITGVNGPSTNHDKTLVLFEVSMTSTGTPTTNIYNGGTF